MAIPPTRERPTTPTHPLLEAALRLCAIALSLVFIGAALGLAVGGALFGAAGVEAMLKPEDVLHAITGTLFTLGGLVSIAASVGLFWLTPRGVRRLSGRTMTQAIPRPVAVFVLTIFYYAGSGLLVLCGAAYAWNGIGPGDTPSLDHPVAGVIMLVSGVAVFVYFPRLIRRLTGRGELSIHHGPFAGGGDFGDGGGGGDF